MNPLPTCERLRELFDYDCDTGVLTWRVSPAPCVKPGDAAGTRSNGYLTVSVSGRRLRVHRVIWCWVFGEWPREVIDHREDGGLNNRLGNLRDVSHPQNLQNQRRAHKGNKSGVLGVSAHGDGYQARITVDGRLIHLGWRRDLSDAATLYQAAKTEHHPNRPETLS